MSSAQAPQVQLDRSLAQVGFASWRLGRDGAVERHAPIDLPLALAHQTTYGTGFLRTRTAVLHNCLLELASGEHACFLRAEGGLRLVRVVAGGATPVIEDSSVLLQSQQSPVPDPEACLAASAVQVGGAAGLLLSSGAGDLTLATPGPGGPVCSATIQAISEPAGPVPFTLAAAAALPDGGIQALAWSIGDKEGSTPAHVRVHSLRLSVSPGGPQQPPQLAVAACRLLCKSAVAPHLAAVEHASGALLLGVDPGEGLADVAAAEQHRPHVARVADDDDAPSPRTLAAAAARLAQYTTETEEEGMVGGGPLVDVFAEGAEPTATATAADCELLLFGQEAAAAELPQPLQRASCKPHRLLAARPGLLGLAADVDCAVVQVAAGVGPSGPALALQHAHSVPALAYVIEGKAQRKFVLLARPGEPIAAVVVEAFRYAYVYFATPAGAANGSHKLVDMSLPEGGSGALGAALLPRAGGCRLLVLTASQLLAWDIS